MCRIEYYKASHTHKSTERKMGKPYSWLTRSATPRHMPQWGTPGNTFVRTLSPTMHNVFTLQGQRKTKTNACLACWDNNTFQFINWRDLGERKSWIEKGFNTAVVKPCTFFNRFRERDMYMQVSTWTENGTSMVDQFFTYAVFILPMGLVCAYVASLSCRYRTFDASKSCEV